MLLDKGEMYFNPCKYFRQKKHQGDGDKDDGGQTLICDSAKRDPYTGIKFHVKRQIKRRIKLQTK